MGLQGGNRAPALVWLRHEFVGGAMEITRTPTGFCSAHITLHNSAAWIGPLSPPHPPRPQATHPQHQLGLVGAAGQVVPDGGHGVQKVPVPDVAGQLVAQEAAGAPAWRRDGICVGQDATRRPPNSRPVRGVQEAPGLALLLG